MTKNEIELRQKMTAKLDAAKAINEAAKDRDLTEDEQRDYDAAMGEYRSIKTRAEAQHELDEETRASGRFTTEPRIRPEAGETRGGSAKAETRSFGDYVQEFVDGDALREFRDAGCHGRVQFRADVDYRSLISSVNTSGGAFIQPHLDPRVVQNVPDRPTALVDLLPHGTTTDNSILEIVDASTGPDDAAEVAEGAAKPETTQALSQVVEPIQTVAAWMNISRQAVEDIPTLKTYLQGRLNYKLYRRIDSQLINGTGTAPNLKGLLNRTGILTSDQSGAANFLEGLRAAQAVGQAVDVNPSVAVLNPSDFAQIDLSKASGSGEFLSGPAGRSYTVANVWGMRVVLSTALAAGTAMLIDPIQVQVWDREALVFALTDSHASNFTSNILTLRGETRVGLSLYAPKAVTKVTL